jgi:hypothetical protein
MYKKIWIGNEIADGVIALSKNTILPSKEEQMKDSIARIKQQPKEVWMVKMCDRSTTTFFCHHQKNGIKKKLQLIETNF